MVAGYVFVTGGDRGIGRATVLKFASKGFTVAFTYFTRKDLAEETLEAVRDLGGEGMYFKLDVRSEDEVKEVARELEKDFPYLNVLVNNAGIISFTKLEETDYREWRDIIDVNLTGTYLVTKYMLPLLRKAPWASVVNLASIAGQTGNVLASAAYCAAKAGVIGLTRRLAVELAPKIRVNAVAPSVIDTDLVRNLIDSEEKLRRVKELHPLKDIGKPEDVAEAIYFLATPSSRFITGQVLGINGGRLTC